MRSFLTGAKLPVSARESVFMSGPPQEAAPGCRMGNLKFFLSVAA